MLDRLALDGADLRLDPSWLAPDEADTLLAQLQQQVDWEVHHIRLFGRDVACPRLSSWIGDTEATYRYSGSEFLPRPWTPTLLTLRERLAAELGVGFNSVLANLYRNGTDSMGWHSDGERELGSAPVIASLSLGAVRRFVLRDRALPARRLTLELPHGSLLVMAGHTQRHFQHALPRSARVTGPRINLTFRRILAGAH